MKTWIMACWLLLPLAGWSQSGPSLGLHLLNEQLSMPFGSFAPVHPGLELSYAPAAKATSYGQRGWEFAAGGFWHGFPAHGAYLRAAYRWQWQPVPVLGLSAAPSLGYAHAFYAQPVYEHTGDGQYGRSGRWGRPGAMLTLDLQATLWPQSRWSPVMGYRWGLEAPFLAFFPAIGRGFWQLGVTYRLPVQG